MEKNLYIVSTPIGNLKDFSERGRLVLSQVDFILCEDTRVSSKLLQNIDIKTKLMVYNDHNATSVIPKIIESIINNDTKFALISDAGTPLVSDPGYKLVNACIENNISYSVVPGSCSVIAALTLSGLPSNRFLFDGFVDSKKFQELSKIESTIILFESPNRLLNTLKNMKSYFNDRVVAAVREITKIFEETVRGNLDYLIKHFEQNAPRGEFVIVISPPIQDVEKEIINLKPLIDGLIDKISIKDISEILSTYSGISKNNIYKFLLKQYKEIS